LKGGVSRKENVLCDSPCLLYNVEGINLSPVIEFIRSH
jgi:hypothetical protein